MRMYSRDGPLKHQTYFRTIYFAFTGLTEAKLDMVAIICDLISVNPVKAK